MNKINPDVESNDSNLCPFKLQWAIGMNVDVPLVNLTTTSRSLIAYACSHVIILYDYVSKDMMILQGHQNAVRALSASRDGKWLFSADYDRDSVCIVWDTETRVPICSLFNPHGKSFLTAAQLSPNARYLVTVGNEESQIVKLWLWTYGKDDPDATVELRETIADRVKKISFSDDFPDEFVLTLDHNVIFVFWKNSKALEVHRPNILQKNRRVTGIFNDSCYVFNSYRAMTVTSNGFVLVWNIPNERFENQLRSCNKLRLVKSVPLQRENLTCIENNKEIIVIGNHSGRLYFYDNQLRLLYWCKDCGFDSIVSVSFDRESSLKRPEVPPSESTISESEMTEEIDTLDTTDEEDISDSSRLKGIESSNTEKIHSPIDNSKEIVVESTEGEEAETKIFEKNRELTTQASGENSLKTMKNRVSSSVTIDLDYLAKNAKLQEPTDCTLRGLSFVVPIFFISSHSGKIARVDITKLKCRFVMHPVEEPVTAIAARPNSDYLVTGNGRGILSLYKYSTRSRMITKKTPTIPDLTKLLNAENEKLDTTYVTCPQTHESLVGVTALKFSPAKDGILACGLRSGLIWMLHPDTLDPIDSKPYKHSSSSIIDIIFTDSGEYLAYSDDVFTVGVFRRNDITSRSSKNLWNFLGKYHSHYMPIREILFLKPAIGKVSPRLLSLGDDQNLVEYDLEKSGPYPEPGLKILLIEKIESHSIPLCMAVYPEFGVETFIITANSEHKFRLVNDYTKTVRTTILGPTIGDPVQQIRVVKTARTKRKNRGYMIFATSKEIGLLILPFDGNPYKIVAMIGHPRKIKSITITDCGKYLFTLGENDRGVFMWKINYKSVDTMKRLGGEGLAPFYSLIDGGKEGWLVNEMNDLFYYGQILQQGENTTATRIISDKVSIMQLPNLMRAVGFYPTNSELETMMEEMSYKNYAETGQLVEEITFEDFVKLYVNHRPAFGVTRNQVKEALRIFAKSDDLENPSITSKQFLEILFGRGRYLQNGKSSGEKLYGEPLSVEEAHTYLRRLVPQDEDSTSYTGSRDDKEAKAELNFEFLPPNISYKTFINEILGIESPQISEGHNAESSC